jgi:exopolysaccharide biosynthesis polyprenyl glycosylphosphotransferase
MSKEPYVLILGSDAQAAELLSLGRQSERGRHKVLGYVSVNGVHSAELVRVLPHLGASAALRDYIFRNQVDAVLVATPLSSSLSKDLLVPILEIGLTVVVPKVIEVSLDHEALEGISIAHGHFLGVDSMLLTRVPSRRGYQFSKRALDLILSAGGLVMLSPLLLLIAVAIKLNNPRGSVLYRLDWVGKNGKPFVGYKFRTMVPDADKLKKELLAFNEMQGPVFKMSNDPRVTRLGRVLRKYSLDELPQLFSVLMGDLSLVGPRAPLREEAQSFEFWQRRKLSVKPGISCLWQIRGRSEIHSFDEWVRLDLQYIETASFLLDLKILMLTIPAVLSGRGAS